MKLCQEYGDDAVRRCNKILEWLEWSINTFLQWQGYYQVNTNCFSMGVLCLFYGWKAFLNCTDYIFLVHWVHLNNNVTQCNLYEAYCVRKVFIQHYGQFMKIYSIALYQNVFLSVLLVYVNGGRQNIRNTFQCKAVQYNITDYGVKNW